MLLRRPVVERGLLVLDRDVDLVGGGHLRHLRPASPTDGYRPAAVASRATSPASASPRNPVSPSPASGRFATIGGASPPPRRGRPTGLRHEHRELAGPQHVAVERDVDAVAAVERPVDVVVDPGRSEIRELGRIEVAGADERDVGGRDGPRIDGHPQRHPPGVARRRRVDRVEVPMSVEPDDRNAPGPRGKAHDRAEMGTTAAPEHERECRQVAALGGHLVLEGCLLEHGRLRIGEREPRSCGHRLSSLAPRARHPHEPRRKLAAAAVALVPRVDRDGGERPTCGTAGTKRAHAIRSPGAACRDGELGHPARSSTYPSP